MHIDYAIELVRRYENDTYVRGDSFVILDAVVSEPELLALVDRVGDEKHRSIAATIREIQASGNRYRRVTKAQKASLAKHLIGIYGSHRAVLAAAYGKTESEMFSDLPAQHNSRHTDNTHEWAAQYAAHAMDAEKKADFLGLPKIKGTQKQAAWAEQIRQSYLVWAESQGIDPIPVLMKHKDARFWIDNRRNFRDISESTRLSGRNS